MTFFFRSFIFNGTPCVLIRLHGFAKVRRWRRRFLGVTTPPKRIHISKNQLCSMEANSARGAHVQLYLNICPRDFSITIYYFYWVWPTKSIRSQIMRLSINLKKGLQARSASHMSTTLMAGPKGQPYVYNTYGWPEGPAIIPRDSSLGRRPSLFHNFFMFLYHMMDT